MPRQRRLSLPCIPQHVIQRGNNRQPCFHSNQDYTVYLNKLSQYAIQYNVEIHAYVLMTNHVHLLLTPETDTGVSLTMQALGRYYVRYFNKRYHRSGTLWEGRFKASLIESDLYFLTVSRYIELNPVRANMIDEPSQYIWSSYQFNALMKPSQIITHHELYLDLGCSPLVRARNYSALFDSEISEFKLREIRGAVNRTHILGSDDFTNQLERKTGLTLIPKSWGGNRRSHFSS